MGHKPRRLELERESKLHSLLSGMGAEDRLEASGVLAFDQSTCYVAFDNFNRVARLDPSLDPCGTNQLVDAPSPGGGFEDIAYDPQEERYFLLIEAMRDSNGTHRGRVAEFDEGFSLQSCAWLSTRFDGGNRGFEGLAHLWWGDRELLWALCEGNLCGQSSSGGGRIQVFERAPDREWAWSHEVNLPETAEMADYSALSVRDGRLAVVSQRSARLWCGRIDPSGRGFEGGGRLYRFPKGGKYCNVEGVSWLGEDRILAVSDRRKSTQPRSCAGKDQSIHIFVLPAD
jgi:hypothetical protein